MKNICSKIITIIILLQNFSFSHATNFYKDDLEIIYSQDKKSLLHEQPNVKRNKSSTIKDNEAQTIQMLTSVSDSLLSFHSNINLMTPIPGSFSPKSGF